MPDTTALERQITSQPEQLEAVLAEPLPASAAERLRDAGRIWLVGTGTSQHAAELGALMLQEAGRDARAMSSMAFANRPPFAQGDGVIVISHNAGAETAFAGASWTMATRAGLPVVPITRRGGSLPDAIETVEKETSHTYTASYTAALVQLARLAHELGADAYAPDALARVPGRGPCRDRRSGDRGDRAARTPAGADRRGSRGGDRSRGRAQGARGGEVPGRGLRRRVPAARPRRPAERVRSPRDARAAGHAGPDRRRGDRGSSRRHPRDPDRGDGRPARRRSSRSR